jgi:hypothetical protein
MVIREAELLFQAGALEAPVIKKYDIEGGWVVTFAGRGMLPRPYRFSYCMQISA